MKLGMFDPLSPSPRCSLLGLESVEVSTGGYVGKSHCDPERLLEDERALDACAAAFAERGLHLDALLPRQSPPPRP